jgi:hypothetical protein
LTTARSDRVKAIELCSVDHDEQAHRVLERPQGVLDRADALIAEHVPGHADDEELVGPRAEDYFERDAGVGATEHDAERGLPGGHEPVDLGPGNGARGGDVRGGLADELGVPGEQVADGIGRGGRGRWFLRLTVAAGPVHVGIPGMKGWGEVYRR